jgi:hypothetical protein
MTDTPIVLVCDDDIRRVHQWVATLRATAGTDRFDVRALTGLDLADAFQALNARAESARNGADSATDDAAGVFDDAAILLFDYDLTPDAQSLADLGEQRVEFHDKLRGRTGEKLAYLARGYSSAGFIVVINQHYRDTTFDITMQRFLHSKADLNITHGDLGNEALWTGISRAENTFSPWAWPVLGKADILWSERLRVIDVEAPLFETLALDPSNFTSRQLDLLGAADPDTAVFGDLARSTLGFDPKDKASKSVGVKAMVASVLGRWLSRTVWQAQNVVADLPHLVSRFPSLMSAESWSRAATKDLSENDVPESLRGHEHWISTLLGRRVWILADVREMAAALPSPDSWPDLVFCEDTSQFVELERAREVETDLPGSYARRFIGNVPGVKYEPFVRLL